FDIAPGVNAASSNAAVTSGSGFGVFTFSGSTQEQLCSVDLTNGAITTVGPIGATGLLGIADQAPAGFPVVAVTSGGQLLRFNSATPATTSTQAVSGLSGSDVLVGIDFRPTTGELMGLGVDAATDTGTLYRIDPQNGTATAIGSAG